MGAITSTIASKFAFFPPTPPSYTVLTDPVTDKLRLEQVDPQPNVEIVKLITKRKQCIVGVLVRNARAKLTMLYSHGNAADLGQMYFTYVELSNTLKMNVFGYDYSGYGASTGKPSEANTYADIEACMDCLLNRYNFREEDIVLYGQSVGSGPTLELASKMNNLCGVVLHSPILSGVRVLYDVKRTYFFDIFKNIDKIGKINCPVLVMHGTEDEVVDVSHGQQLAELCKHPFDPLWVRGGHHCDLEIFPEYIIRLRKFINFLEK